MRGTSIEVFLRRTEKGHVFNELGVRRKEKMMEEGENYGSINRREGTKQRE